MPVTPATAQAARTERRGAAAHRAWTVTGCVVLAAVILAHAALLGRSRWQGDEYITLAWMKQIGRPFLISWYLTWSPRLWSDILFAAFGAVVDWVHRPLAGTCMATLWAGLAAACLLPAVFGSTGSLSRGRRLGRVFVGLSILSLFLVGHGLTEIFFWPAGGLSYLPTLAGVAWLFWCVADGLAARRIGAALALLLTAGSSEVGIFFVLAFAFTMVAATLIDARLKQGASAGSLLWLLPGVAMALVDLGLVLHGRVGTVEISGAGNPYLHHAVASVRGALPGFLAQLAGFDSNGLSWSGALHCLARLLVLAAARCFSQEPPGRMLLAFAIALVIAAFASSTAALYQFGVLCCERHDSIRDCFIMLALFSAGAWSATTSRSESRGVAPMLAAILVLFAPRAPLLAGEYALTARTESARARTWESGLAPGNGMTLFQEPAGKLIKGDGLTPGTYVLTKDTGWTALGVLEFFGKKTLTIKEE